MVMRGEEGAATGDVVKVLSHAPGNRETVKGCRSPSDLIEQDKTAGGGIVQDIRRLVHLDHEGGVPFGKVVTRPDTCEDPIGHADLCRGGGDPASHLGHHGEEADLTEIGRLACHVGAGDDSHAVLGGIEIGVIRNESLASGVLLQHGVTAVTDLQDGRVIHNGARVAVETGGFSQRSESIERSRRSGCLLKRKDLLQHGGTEMVKDLDLQGLGPFFGSQDLPLHFLKLRRDESLTSRGGLLARVVGGDAAQVGRRDLDEVTEDGIEANLERLDSGALNLLFLQGCDPDLPLGGGILEFIERGVES